MSTPILGYATTTPIPPTGVIPAMMGYANNVRGLTGGGSTNLDGVPTLYLSVGTILIILIADAMETWQLKAGTYDSLDVGQVQPLDYDATINQKYWNKAGGY